MKNIIYKSAILIFLLIFNIEVFAQPETTVHFLFFGATLDMEAGESIKANEKKMRETFKRINNKTIKLNFKSFTGYSFRLKRFYQTIDNLQVNTNDVIIFYYSGHGFRYGDTESEFPYLLFFKDINDITEEEIRNNSIAFDKVEEYIQQRTNVRLKLIIAEACNTDYDAITMPKPPGVLCKNSVLRKLFIESAGTYKVCSSSKNENSYAYNNGGVFTMMFAKAFRESLIKEEKPSWDKIFEETKKLVKEKARQGFGESQTVYHKRFYNK